MIIKKLQFEGFRNLKDGTIVPCEGVNVIFGTNAQGKTNLLESIWLFSGNRSFRGSNESDFIHFERPFAKLSIEFFSEEREQTAEILFQKGKKEIKINGIKQKSSAALLGKLCAVVFSPEHLSLIKSGPSERRRFIDSAICQVKPSYAELFSRYNRVLAQRNALLKDIPYHSQLLDTLEIWDYRLAVLGASLIKMRIQYVERLCQIAKRYHLGISENSEDLSIVYDCNFVYSEQDNTAEIRDSLMKDFLDSRTEDINGGFTSCGPHRHDLNIEINGNSVKKFGSQGQQRSCVLSIKIAEAELLKIATEQEPIFLLDDVLSELDSKRQEFLLNKISERQVFISCCEKASVERLKNGRLFEVKNGEVKAC